MKNTELKVGQSFEIVKFPKVESYYKEVLRKYYPNDTVIIPTENSVMINSDVFLYGFRCRKVAKLTITKLK